MMNLVVQFVAAAMLLVGLWRMGNRRLDGPLLAAASEVLWIAAFIPHRLWGGVFLSVVLFAMQVRNALKWYREGVR